MNGIERYRECACPLRFKRTAANVRRNGIAGLCGSSPHLSLGLVDSASAAWSVIATPCWRDAAPEMAIAWSPSSTQSSFSTDSTGGAGRKAGHVPLLFLGASTSVASELADEHPNQCDGTYAALCCCSKPCCRSESVQSSVLVARPPPLASGPISLRA